MKTKQRRDGFQRIGWAIVCVALMRLTSLALAARFLAFADWLLMLANAAHEKAKSRP